jgi:hypothetical protein
VRVARIFWTQLSKVPPCKGWLTWAPETQSLVWRNQIHHPRWAWRTATLSAQSWAGLPLKGNHENHFRCASILRYNTTRKTKYRLKLGGRSAAVADLHERLVTGSPVHWFANPSSYLNLIWKWLMNCVQKEVRTKRGCVASTKRPFIYSNLYR